MIGRVVRPDGQGQEPGETEANAHLIASAPDLKAALDKIINNWDNLHPKDRAQARDALAKAENREVRPFSWLEDLSEKNLLLSVSNMSDGMLELAASHTQCQMVASALDDEFKRRESVSKTPEVPVCGPKKDPKVSQDPPRRDRK